jgi:2-polyprenyl-6-methoxyphenol hydroxylase-like FAD-dependent oxidoreductase
MAKQVGLDLNQRALVIGAGIGGLCAAIALYNQGWQVTVFESSPERRDEGAGIVLAANAIKALAMVGIRGEVERLGAPVGKAEIRTWDGQLLVDLPTASQAQRYGSPSYLIHRSALQAILYDRLKEGTTVQFNKKLVQIEQSSELVTACFADGSQATGGLLIGADGIHSKVREQLFGRPDLRLSEELRNFTISATPCKQEAALKLGGLARGLDTRIWVKAAYFGLVQLTHQKEQLFLSVSASKQLFDISRTGMVPLKQ